MDESEAYIPEKPLYYNFNFRNFLKKESNQIPDLNEYIGFYLCIYKINVSGKYPFLQYLLLNNGFNLLTLPMLFTYNSFGKNEILPYSKSFLSGLLGVEYEKIDKLIKFDGFYDFDSNLYLFFDITECNIEIDETNSSNLKFGLIDEILNHKKICNIKISPEVTNLFLKNESINYLLNEDYECYEIPIVGYVEKQTENMLKFTSIFGESARDKLALFGPYFYFTNYENAIKKCGKKGGIVRFALFTGITKFVSNFPNDNIDKSIIKNELLKVNYENNKKKNIQTLRISDHDGLWSVNNDSICVGELELDDGSFLDDTPIIVLKDYKQQIPLSYHFTPKYI
jgi:hypothetical protein